MSIWWHKTDECGRRYIFTVGFPWFTAMLLTATCCGLVPRTVEHLVVAALVLFVVTLLGCALFAIAKLSVILRGPWVSFGAELMSPAMRRIYDGGYALMGGGGILTLACIAAIRVAVARIAT